MFYFHIHQQALVDSPQLFSRKITFAFPPYSNTQTYICKGNMIHKAIIKQVSKHLHQENTLITEIVSINSIHNKSFMVPFPKFS